MACISPGRNKPYKRPDRDFKYGRQITLSTIFKAKQGDVSAYKALMDSAYGSVKQSLELTDAEQPIFKQLDIDVIDD